jgi:hypothetical protein
MPAPVRAHVLLAVLLASLAGVLIAACGGATRTTRTTVSASGAPRTPTGRSAGAPTTPASHTTGASAKSPTTTSTTGPGAGGASGTVPACTAAMLKLSYLGGQGATGHGLLAFALTDVSSHACHTYGYPGVQFLSATGASLPTNATRTTRDFFGSAPERALTLAAGQSASFRLGVTHSSAGGGAAGCQTAAALQVIPPDDTHTLRVTIGNGGAYECATATVTPLQPGDSAYGS